MNEEQIKKQKKEEEKQYEKLVNSIVPKISLFKNCARAYFIGGLICVFGQIIQNTLLHFGVEKELTTNLTPIILVFIGVLATGLGLYQKLGKFAGCGSIVPITGFANAVSSPAIEYRKEGLVMGVGAKIFTVAGPVILYGTLFSFIVGLVYYLLGGGKIA